MLEGKCGPCGGFRQSHKARENILELIIFLMPYTYEKDAQRGVYRWVCNPTRTSLGHVTPIPHAAASSPTFQCSPFEQETPPQLLLQVFVKRCHDSSVCLQPAHEGRFALEGSCTAPRLGALTRAKARCSFLLLLCPGSDTWASTQTRPLASYLGVPHSPCLKGLL